MSTLLSATGLQTFVNNLGAVREGSLSVADNVVIDKPNVIEPRRGFKEYTTQFPHINDRAKQLLSYKGRLLTHYFDNTLAQNKLAVDNGSTNFTTLSGTFNEVESGLRIKFLEANSNFYFTTDEGIKKLSVSSASNIASATITDAGGIKATDVTATIDYNTPGFFLPESKVSYTVTWGITDANGNFIEGSPSQRYVLTNYSLTDSAVVKLYITIPNNITSNYEYRIYRTGVFEKGLLLSLDDIDPGTEHQLVIQKSYSEATIVLGRINETDITPEDFRVGGTYLYTNPVSGEGIENANEPPPLSKDLTLFKGVTFYSNTKSRHRLNLNLLSVDNLISGTHKFIVSDGTITNEYTFRGVKEHSLIDMTGKTGALVAGKYFLINSANDERLYYVWYDTGASIDPLITGKIGIKVSVIAGDADTVLVTKTRDELNSYVDFTAAVNADPKKLDVDNVENGNTTNTSDGDSGFGFTTTIEGDGEDLVTGEILISGLVSIGQAVDTTARSLVRVINADATSTINAYYLSGSDDVPGEILLEARTSEDIVFFIAVNDSAIGSEFSPSLPSTINITAVSATNPAEVDTTAVLHGLQTNDLVVIYNSGTTPLIDGVRVATYVSNVKFTVDVDVSIGSGAVGKIFKGSVSSDNDIAINSIYYSKYQQPEAVPLINYIPVGKKDEPILRILPLRDSLFIFKTDGLFRLSGVAGNFQVTLFDSNVTIIAPDSAVVLNNQIFLLAQDGVTLVTESGASVISWDIKDLIDTALRTTNVSTASFGVNYDSDHSYLLWTTKNTEDTYATQAFRYNFFTSTWTRWELSDRCGIINPVNNKIYLGAATRNKVDEERKNFNRKDYADREFGLSILTNGVDDKTVQITSSQNISIGDVITQTQYLTLYEYNQTLNKISTDSLAPIGLTSTILSLLAVAGNDLRNKVDSLATLLQAQLGGIYTPLPNGGSAFSDIQEDFNHINTRLNLDAQIYQSNFRESVGTKDFDYRIDSINGNKIDLRFSPLLITGVASIVKGINTKVRYNPIHFGNPSTLKQVHQGTYIFDNRNSFSSAIVSYATDLSTGFESVDFEFPGAGVWGQFNWGDMTWGGERNYAPMRTYLPQQKQRCRFVTVQFEHGNAYESYTLLGISLEARETSVRAYL